MDFLNYAADLARQHTQALRSMPMTPDDEMQDQDDLPLEQIINETFDKFYVLVAKRNCAWERRSQALKRGDDENADEQLDAIRAADTGIDSVCNELFEIALSQCRHE